MEENKSNEIKAKEKKSDISLSGSDTGYLFGCALAIVLSYSSWYSLKWAIIHGLLSWVYVIYFAVKYYF